MMWWEKRKVRKALGLSDISEIRVYGLNAVELRSAINFAKARGWRRDRDV